MSNQTTGSETGQNQLIETCSSFEKTIDGLTDGDLFLLYSCETRNPDNEILTIARFNKTFISSRYMDMMHDEALAALDDDRVIGYRGIVDFQRKLPVGS